MLRSRQQADIIDLINCGIIISREIFKKVDIPAKCEGITEYSIINFHQCNSIKCSFNRHFIWIDL